MADRTGRKLHGQPQSFLCHHAPLVSPGRNPDQHRSGHYRKPGTPERFVYHIQRGHESWFLAKAAHQIPIHDQRTVIHPPDQLRTLHWLCAYHPALPHIFAHGSRLRTGHHHNHADDHHTPRLLSPSKRSQTMDRGALHPDIPADRRSLFCGQHV